MKSSPLKILVVDDDLDIIEILKYNLNKSGYLVKSAKNGIEAIKRAKKFMPNIILMDVMMPEMSGIEACSEIKQIDELSETMIIFLSARSEDYTQISAYDAGADDYISKPIKPKILIKKISNIAKKIKSNKNMPIVLDLGSIKINREEHLVIQNKNELNLPRKEFELLFLLASKPEKVFTRDEIMNKVWGTQIVVGDRTIDVHVRKLREKIGEKYIKTLKGVGYKFKP
jgi:two-component system alkaline phosphatase synthesis response regulator PhoP